MKNRLREELEAMLGLHTGDSFTADNVHTLVNGILAVDEVGGFEYVGYDGDAFPSSPTIGDTTEEIEGLGPATEEMIHTIFIMPNKEADPDATMMIVVDEKDPDSGSYQYVYVGNINNLPSDVLTESSIINDLSTGGTNKPLSAEQGRTLNSHVNYTTCESGAADEVKLISDDGFELSTHLRLLVKMNNTNTHSTPKFNINNTGAKDVWYNGSVASDTNTWAAGEVLDVYYDGTRYIANTHGGAQFSTGEKVGDVGIANIPGTNLKSVMSQKGATDLVSEYNVSINNNNAEYTFAQAVALVPASLQKGGLTIKYLDSTTHQYTIKRLMSSTWNTTESNWQGIDNEPTAGSNNLVKSGGVQNELALGAVYDVSTKNPTAGPNNDGKFESLSALLSDANLNTLIPIYYRKGGMSIKFINNVPATYNVVKTEGLDIEPTTSDSVIHITGDTNPNIEDGLYNASDLSSLNTVSALPTINNIKTYYIAITETVEEETVTTYTTWDVVKVSEDSGVYVQYRYTKNVYTNDSDVNTGNFQFISSQNWVEIDEADKNLQYIKENYNYVVSGYINSNGEIVTHEEYKCTNFISVRVGDVLVCNGDAPGIGFIMSCYDNKTSLIYPLLSHFDTNDRIIIIRDNKIKYIRACAANNNISRKLVKLNPNFLGNIVDAIKDNGSDIDLLKDIVCNYIEDFLQKSDSVPNRYINNQGTIISSNDYYYKEFEVTAGSILTIKTRVDHPNVSVLSKKIDTTRYQDLLSGTTGLIERTYTVQEDCTVAVSFIPYRNDDRYFKAINKVQFQNIVEEVKNLDNTLDEKLINEGVLSIVDDNFTDGLNGFSVRINGQTNPDAGYNSKTFEILAGARVIFTSYTHPLIVPLAKKDGNSYTVLCTAQGYNIETFEYVAAENMTLVASYVVESQNPHTHINIKTSLVNSNNENIQSLLAYRMQLNESLMIQNIELGFLFNKIAVIGDSMSVATMDGYQSPLGAAWLSFLAKRWDCQGKEFYAAGGTQCYSWLNNDVYGLGKFLRDETIYNCYFIAYGHNDNKTVGEATDEAAPVTISEGNVPSCPDGYTFCAYYKAIINQIRTKAPHAMIFCLSQYDYSVAPGGWHSEYGEAVIDIAEWYYNNGDKLIHHLDTGGVPISNMEIGTHYSTIGYAYIASKINEEANKVIYQYRADEEIKSFGVYNL